MDSNICFLNSNDGTGLLGFDGQNLQIFNTGDVTSKIQSFIDSNHSKYIFLCLSYDLKNHIENLYSQNTDRIKFPTAMLWSPDCVAKINGDHIEIVQGPSNEVNKKKTRELLKGLKQQNGKTNNINFRKGINKESYINSVKTLQNHIQRGDIYEVNFCQEYIAENVDLEDVKNTYLNINNITDAPFSSYLKFNEFEVFCGSPERYIKKKGLNLIAQPIKGTAKRGLSISDDNLLQEKLKNDPKERAENIMIVDLMRNDLSKIAQKGSVKVDELCKVYTFKTVHQMISTVSCKMKSGTNFNDILKATFPMGSMTGAPKIRAMELIEKHESFKRGLYSGSIGYIAPNGDFDLNVIIRTMVYNKKLKNLSCAVGSAITINSIPENEYEECAVKIQKLLDGVSG
jgi:para-aminobenzoate synthetase component 1